MTTPETEPTILQRDPAWTCATWQDLFVLVWRGQPTPERSAINVRFLNTFADSRPGGFCLLIILEPETTPPEDRARQMLAETMRRNGARVRGSAYFIPQNGFKGSLLRSVVTGLSLIAREPYPTHTFAELHEAARWLNSRLPHGAHPPPSPQRIEVIAQQIRIWG